MRARYRVTFSAGTLAVLAGCQTTPSQPAPPVCALSAVWEVNSLVNRLSTGFKSGPIGGGTKSGLSEALIEGSFSEGIGDASDVTLPGPTVVRMLADELIGTLGSPTPPPLSHSTTGTGQWVFGPGPTRNGVARWSRVSATRLGGEIRVCYVSDAYIQGNAILAFPQSTSSTGWGTGDISLWGEAYVPGPLEDPNTVISGAGRVGPFIDISCAGAEQGFAPDSPPTELHVCALAQDGWIYHTIYNGSRWTPFGNVQQVVGNHGPAEAVACAVEGRTLHLVAAIRHANGWFVEHTIRAPSGSWSQWNYAHQAGGIPQGSPDPIRDVGAAICDADGPMPPSGPRETRRLNVAWITDHTLSVVERSRGVIDWAPGSGLPAGNYSPPFQGWRIPSNVTLKTISIAQMPFPP